LAVRKDPADEAGILPATPFLLDSNKRTPRQQETGAGFLSEEEYASTLRSATEDGPRVWPSAPSPMASVRPRDAVGEDANRGRRGPAIRSTAEGGRVRSPDISAGWQCQAVRLGLHAVSIFLEFRSD